MPTIKTQSGIEWHYDIEGDGKCLLFLHGWGVDRRIWRQQCKYFSQHYRVMTIDLPGHGKSSWKKIELEDMAHDLRFIFETLKVETLTLVGSSLGGLFALKLYELYPAYIKNMIFVGSMPKFSKSEGYPYGLDVNRIRKLGGQVSSDYPSIIDIFFRSLFTKQERQTRRYKWLQKFRRMNTAPMQSALSEYLDILEKEDLRDVFKKVGVPVQFINGTDDVICTKETVLFLQTLLPGSRADFFNECGHFPFLSKPYKFNEVMRAFLNRVNV